MRGGIIDPDKFIDLPGGSNPFREKFEKALAEVAAADKKANALVAVFGAGYPTDPRTGGAVPTGFTGIENIHMNQGAMNLVHGAPYYLENGPNQDGGLIFLLPTGAKGFFVPFPSQTTSTDLAGNPTVTGIKEIDRTSTAGSARPSCRGFAPPGAAARRKVARTSAKHAARTRPASTTAAPLRAATPSSRTPASGTSNSQGFLFADFDPNDSSGKYIPDDDGNTYNTPLRTLSKGQTKGPVPTPRSYPRMDLASVVGANPPGYVGSGATKSIAFDIIGDSGAPTQKKLDEYETKVTELMTADATKAPPAFCFQSSVVTVSLTPFGSSSVLAFQPILTSSPTCAGTMRLIASRVRPSPVTAISTPLSSGRSVAAAWSVTSFMSTRCSRSAAIFTFDQSVVGSELQDLHHLLDGAECVLPRQGRLAAEPTLHPHHSRVT